MKCSICGEVAEYRCPMCGRSVCSIHFNEGRGLCCVCVDALCSFCNTRLSVARCIYCGRLGCDSCLVQVDNVRRVCRDCLSSRALRVEEALRGLERLRVLTLRMLRA